MKRVLANDQNKYKIEKKGGQIVSNEFRYTKAPSGDKDLFLTFRNEIHLQKTKAKRK
jgi:hypothetical protein